MNEIVTMAKAFWGRAMETEEEMLLTRLCEESFIQWGSRMRAGVSPEDCAEALIPACAWTALSGFLAGRQAAAPWSSFRAGDVTVSSGTGTALEQVQNLRGQAETIMRPYVEDDGFVFQGVRG